MENLTDSIRRQFSIDLSAGKLVRLHGRHAGSEGGATKAGYISIMVDGKRYYLHRLIWLLAYGEWPAGVVDHIDGNPRNNSITNLRLATKSQNAANSSVSHARSGVKGVRWFKPLGKWHARIMKDRKEIHIGYFDSAEAAGEAYRAKSRELFGTFAWAN